jgi:hypothetical protein
VFCQTSSYKNGRRDYIIIKAKEVQEKVHDNFSCNIFDCKTILETQQSGSQ